MYLSPDVRAQRARCAIADFRAWLFDSRGLVDRDDIAALIDGDPRSAEKAVGMAASYAIEYADFRAALRAD